MFLLRDNAENFWSEIIAAEAPEPVRAPRYVPWPSVCDTTRTNWLSPEADLQPADPQTQTFTIDVGAHTSSSPLFVSFSPPILVSPAATPDQQTALKRCAFSHIAAPTPVSPDLYTTSICAPGIPLPPPKLQPEPNKPPMKKPKKRGRPIVFDEIKRAEFLGMLKAGCTIRYAARRVGVSNAAVYLARDRDPLFAARLDRAQQERDILSIGRIQNAGEKSWRAAAWLLERNEPKEFSLKHRISDPWSIRGQRRLKKLITEVVDNRLADHLPTKCKSMTDRAGQLIEDRLAEIESLSAPYRDSDDEHIQSYDPEAHDDETEYDVLNGDEFDEDDPGEDFQENDGFANEDAAIEAYRRALRKLNHT
ncbi:MAG: hypothetical protein WD894_04745 [Pirellulales bacterium]